MRDLDGWLFVAHCGTRGASISSEINYTHSGGRYNALKERSALRVLPDSLVHNSSNFRKVFSRRSAGNYNQADRRIQAILSSTTIYGSLGLDRDTLTFI